MNWTQVLPERMIRGIRDEIQEEHDQMESSPDRIHVTELTGCLRKAYLRRVSPVPLDFHQSLHMWRGRLLHSTLLKHYEQREVPLELPVGGFAIAGRADAVDGDRVVELKVTPSIHFIEKRGMPHPWHVRQLQFYMHCLGVSFGELYYLDLSRALRFPVNSSFPHREGAIELEQTVEEMKTLASELHHALEIGEAPGAINVLEFGDGGAECPRCEYREDCQDVQSA